MQPNQPSDPAELAAKADSRKRILKAVLEYYESAPFQFEPSREDFSNWLKTLRPGEQESYRWLGLETCRHMLAFRQFYFRQRGYRLESYLASKLTLEDFKDWLTMK